MKSSIWKVSVKIIAVLSACAILSSCETMNNMRIEDAMNTAVEYSQQGDYEKAIEKFDKALNIDDTLMKLWIGKLNAQISNNDLSGAADTIKAAVNKKITYYTFENDDIQELNEILLELCEKKWNTASAIKQAKSIIIENGWLDNTGLSLNDGTIKVYLDGEKLQFDNEPFMFEERVLVPVHPLMDKLGWKAEVNPYNSNSVSLYSPPEGEYNHTRIISCTADFHTVTYSDDITANVDGGVGCKVVIDTVPKMQNGELMIPLRVVAQIIGRSVIWDENTMSVYIDSKISDEELVDPDVAEFAGTMGAGQSKNFVYDIDRDEKQELICIGYGHSSECLITVYDRDGSGTFSISTEIPLIEADNGNHPELLEFIKLVGYYDEMKRLQAEHEREQEKKKQVEQAKNELKLEAGAPPQYGASYALTEETAIKLIKMRYGVDAKLIMTGTTMYTFEGGGKRFSVQRWYNTDSVDAVEFTVSD